MDDVINVAGHRLGTAEIEDVMVGICQEIMVTEVVLLVFQVVQMDI